MHVRPVVPLSPQLEPFGFLGAGERAVLTLEAAREGTWLRSLDHAQREEGHQRRQRQYGLPCGAVDCGPIRRSASWQVPAGRRVPSLWACGHSYKSYRESEMIWSTTRLYFSPASL